jgi:chaperonin GroES
MMLKPYRDKILIETHRVPDQIELASGIVWIPRQRQRGDYRIGTVCGVGHGVMTKGGIKIVPDLRAGDTVVYAEYGSRREVLGDTNLRLTRYIDVHVRLGNLNRPFPLHDRVIVKRDPPDEVSSGGIFIPENAREKTNHGKVVAVGPGTNHPISGEFIPTTLKVGQHVVFTVAAFDADLIHPDYTILLEDAVIAELED